MESSSPIKNFFCDVFGIETKEEKALREEQNSPKPEEQQKPATDEEKKAKEREWKDLTEEVKFVCWGGKVLCKYSNPPIAEMLPTSTQVMLQDKPYMTANDKDGKVNFNFTGVCTHPSQQKPFSPPPPCKAVINLSAWKDYSETMIDDYNALLVKSKIPCMISGENLEIIHSGQKAELTEVKLPLKRKPQIIESYWVNADGERIEKIIPNQYATLVIKTKDYRPKDAITIKLPVNGEEKEFVTRVNSQGIATLKNVFKYEIEHLKKEPQIKYAYWRNKHGEKISDIYTDEGAELFLKTEGYDADDEIEITLQKEKEQDTFRNRSSILILKTKVNSEGIAIIKNFKRWD